ncbi:MAG: aspartate aminotransferase family protein [Peptostreptococcaceae bacterium]
MSIKVIDYQETWDENFIGTYNQLPVVIDYGQNSILYDIDGKSYVDFSSGIGVTSLGHNHEKLNNALHSQIDKITHLSNIIFNEPLLKAGEKIIKASKLEKVFFCNSGTEANECAIKLARKYSYDKYGSNRYKVLSLVDGFHGRTIGALMATPNKKYQEGFFPNHDGFDYIEKDISCLDKVDECTCAIIIEVIQGESGVKPLDKEFVKKLEKVCKEKDIVLICDEVQSGIGRSGKLFAYEHYDIQPDIVTMAKGLGGGIPVGGILVNSKLACTFQKGSHGTTFGGNPLAMTAAGTVIDEIESNGFYEEVDEKGKFLIEKIKSFNKESIVDVRGYGLMIGIETTLDISEVQKKALEEGLLVLTAGKNVIRLLPPLTITYEEMMIGIEKLEKCF